MCAVIVLMFDICEHVGVQLCCSRTPPACQALIQEDYKEGVGAATAECLREVNDV